MAHIISQFRIITFFCLFIILVTYLLMYLNFDKNVKRATCDELGHLVEKNHGDKINIGHKHADREELAQSFMKRKPVVWGIDKLLKDRLNIQHVGQGNRNNEANIGVENSRKKLHLHDETNFISRNDAKPNKLNSWQMRQNAFVSNSDKSLHDNPTKITTLRIVEEGKLTAQRNIIQKHLIQDNGDNLVAKSQSMSEKRTTQDDTGDDHDSVDELSAILKNKIRIASSILRKAKTKPGCDSNETISNSCDNNRCLRMFISEDPKERIEQMVTPKKLQLSYNERSTLSNMRSKVFGFYDTVLITAASSNHFLESQALLKNLHENIFPYLKNFVLIYYNIGLTLEERSKLEKFCNCTVVDFPFDKTPGFVGNLKCYSWKPLIIKAHITQGNVLVWMDASVRFQNIADLNKIIERTKARGFQMAGPSEKSPFRTVRSMYHFFGEEPCAYLQMGQLHATLGFFKNDSFVNRAILEPWAACAFNQSCICPANFQQRVSANRKMIKKWREEGGPIVYGQIHRYDQSAISLIIHKLFYKYYPYALFDRIRYNVKFLRRDTVNYFPFTTNNGNT